MGTLARTRYTREIRTEAAKHGLDPNLVEALVLQESAGNTDAFRFEPNFWNRYLKNNLLYKGRNPRRVSSSYGLMQVMFPVAVEDGLDSAAPPETLFVPERGLEAGCRRLAKLLAWAKGFPGTTAEQQLWAALASYNGGRGGNEPGSPVLRNGIYARQVLDKLANLAPAS